MSIGRRDVAVGEQTSREVRCRSRFMRSGFANRRRGEEIGRVPRQEGGVVL